MEILTYKKVYQLVGDDASGTNECITKSAAVEIAQAHRKDITSNLSQYLNNEYIDIFSVEDKPDLSNFSFTNKGYNPQASGNTYTTSVSSRDIDGNTIPYNATSDVDWITNIVINGTEIRFTVSPNIGDQRTGHITGSNATGKSDTITIIQEAKEADVDCTYTLVATCDSVPTVTINGTSITRYTTSGNNYTFQYTVRVRTESEAPQSVGFTVNGGGVGESYNDGTISLLPSSWSLNEGLSKQFTVNYSRVKTTKTWDNTSGTISRDGSVNVAINASDTIEHPTIDYTISDTHVSGQSFSHSKDGMQFTSAASSVNCTGTISVQYNGLKATSIVTYAEEFPDDTEHRWIDVSPTQFAFPADGGSVDIIGTYGLTGTLGTRKEVGSISDTITVDANTTTSPRSGSKTYYYNNDQSQTPTVKVSWTQDKVDTTQLIVPKFSTDGNTWTTNPMVLSWEAENTNALTYYYRVEVITKNASTGEIISTTNFDKVGYTIVNQNGDHFNASINGNKVTVRPISANTSYTDTIKTILSITPLGKETNHEFFGQSTFIHQYKGVKVENADMVVFTFGWNTGKDLDCATYVNDHVVGNEDKYAGFLGGAVNSNVGGKNEYLMFAGDNQGTGKEYTCVDFNALAKYVENHADDQSTINGKKLKESFINSDGNFVITIDIYNNWYNAKNTETIELDYSAYNYTQKSITPTINSTDDKTFAITGATIVKTNLDNAICYANWYYGCNNIKHCYTKTAEFVYYLNSGQFYIKTNKDNVSLWNKGFSYKEDSKNYNTKYSNSLSSKNNNLNYSIQINSINLPKNKTAQITNYLSVNLSSENNYGLTFTMDFLRQEIQNNTTFPKTYSDNISTSDIINKALERIHGDDNFKSNTYITAIYGNTIISAIDDYTVPECFESETLNASKGVNLGIKLN